MPSYENTESKWIKSKSFQCTIYCAGFVYVSCFCDWHWPCILCLFPGSWKRDIESKPTIQQYTLFGRWAYRPCFQLLIWVSGGIWYMTPAMFLACYMLHNCYGVTFFFILAIIYLHPNNVNIQQQVSDTVLLPLDSCFKCLRQKASFNISQIIPSPIIHKLVFHLAQYLFYFILHM